MPITRKEFLGGLAGGTALLLLNGCGGGGSSYSGGSMMSYSGCNETIAANHGHVLTIALSDLDSMVDKTYDIRGTADHTHSVTFTVAQLGQLKAGQTVNVTSTTSSSVTYGTHSHAISANCVL
jgi:hypothetical protein